jgi:hypothetical protein
MAGNYNKRASARFGFHSNLERRWSVWFSFHGMKASYIGNSCNFADFEVDGIYVEVKPDGMQFVEAAFQRAVRYRKCIIIVEGFGYLANWWVVTLSRKLAKITPPQTRETLVQCLIRNGLHFR